MTTKRVPKKPEERRVWIVAMLTLKRSSFAAIGRELDPPVSRQAVRKVLFKPHRKMEEAIAKKLGIPARKIWPERYPE